jgi:hypothetical protein
MIPCTVATGAQALAQLLLALCYKPEGCRFDLQIDHSSSLLISSQARLGDRICGLVLRVSRVRFPALSDFLSSSGSGMGSTQPL